MTVTLIIALTLYLAGLYWQWRTLRRLGPQVTPKWDWGFYVSLFGLFMVLDPISDYLVRDETWTANWFLEVFLLLLVLMVVLISPRFIMRQILRKA